MTDGAHRDIRGGDALAVAEAEYERVRDEFVLIIGIREGLRELHEGKCVPHEQVMAELRAIVDRGVTNEIASLDRRIASLTYDLDLLKGIREGLDDVENGRLIPHEQVMAELKAILSQERSSHT